MKTRAAVLMNRSSEPPFGTSKPVTITEVDLAPPGDGEVLVRIDASGLCHSDLSLVTGAIPRPIPAVVGHEAAATVVEPGRGVHDLAPGDRVVTVFVPSCGSCLPCAEGRPALCEPGAATNAAGTLLGGLRRLSLDGEPIHHHLGVSSFAEHAVVSRRSLVRVDGDLPDPVAALFGCAVLTGVGAVVNTAKVRAGETVVIVGLGGVGMSAVLGALATGARCLAVDLSEQKRATALALGADLTFDAADPRSVDAILEATHGGADHALEMVGAVPALDLAMRVTRRGGTTTIAGIAQPDARYALAAAAMVGQERVLQGSYLGGCVPIRDVPRFMDLHRRGRLPVDRLLAGSGPLDSLNDALDTMAAGHSGRYVLIP